VKPLANPERSTVGYGTFRTESVCYLAHQPPWVPVEFCIGVFSLTRTDASEVCQFFVADEGD